MFLLKKIIILLFLINISPCSCLENINSQELTFWSKIKHKLESKENIENSVGFLANYIFVILIHNIDKKLCQDNQEIKTSSLLDYVFEYTALGVGVWVVRKIITTLEKATPLYEIKE